MLQLITNNDVKMWVREEEKLRRMGELQELFKAYDHGNGPWYQYLKTIKVSNIHGWYDQEIEFRFPIVAIVGENGIGKSTFLKAAVCAYKNSSGKDFYPSKMFMSTQWDRDGLQGAMIEYQVKLGSVQKTIKWKKTKDWGYSPKKEKPKRNVFFLDISRTVPLDATAGYAKIAMTANTEVVKEKVLSDVSIRDLSYVLGQTYISGKFTTTNVDTSKEVGLLTKIYGEISQFHQGAGEDTILDIFKLLQDIPEQSLLVIDEVENSLHPQAQRRFIRHLIKCARNKRLQIILSTHSPFVLDELPAISRIMLQQLSDRKNIVYGPSTQFALSAMDDIEHPVAYIHVEDHEAGIFFWNIIKSNREVYSELINKISLREVGSCTIVNTLNALAEDRKLPYNSISIVDGDKRSDYPSCMSLPGSVAPERLVFEGLKEKQWNQLDERFGVGAGSLFKYLDDAMIDPEHHNWTTLVGDKIKQSSDTVWRVMTEEWIRQCYSSEGANEFIESILEKVREFESSV